MKNQLIVSLCLLGITACSAANPSGPATLADMFVWGSNAQETPKVRQVNVALEADVAHPEVEQVDVAAEEVVVGSGYNLAKRGDRYDQANYIMTPQVYGIVASRVANKMLADTPGIFAENKNAPLYIADTVQIDRYLPDGPQTAGKAAKDILYGSKMFNIVTERDKAAFILESTVNNANTPEIPIIVYEMKLYNAKGELLGSWTDTIRQVLNDDGSWW